MALTASKLGSSLNPEPRERHEIADLALNSLVARSSCLEAGFVCDPWGGTGQLVARSSTLAAYGLRLTAYGLRLTAYGLRLTAYGFALQPEVLSQIHFANALVVQNVVGVAFSDDLAVADDIGVVTDIECLTHVVVGDQDADIAFLELADD